MAELYHFSLSYLGVKMGSMLAAGVLSFLPCFQNFRIHVAGVPRVFPRDVELTEYLREVLQSFFPRISMP